MSILTRNSLTHGVNVITRFVKGTSAKSDSAQRTRYRLKPGRYPLGHLVAPVRLCEDKLAQ